MIPFPDKKYNIIYADPPWEYRNKKTGGYMSSGAVQHYNVLSIDEIKSLPVQNISENNSVLFLWVTVPLLPEGLDVLTSWGFKYKTMLTWRKTTTIGMGFWFRGQVEHLLLGVKGKVKAFRCQKANFLQLKSLKHSQKPNEFRELIELATNPVFDNSHRIELFARQKVQGWDSWGNEL